ncbi:MAG: glutathione S-transferase family protein [Pseudomonas sp.]
MKFFFHPSPNPMKVALLLEELQTPYELIAVDTFKGEQHTPAYLAINPNAKVPALSDGEVNIFDSHAILLHLAQKSGRFMPAAGQQGEMLSWLMFIATGLSPFSGQAVHFLHHAPEAIAYARNRYLKEVERHYAVLDQRLATSRYLASDDYSIADMALWGWANYAGYILGEAGLSGYPNVKRLFDEISARPAAVRAHGLKEKLVLKAEFDEETRRALFPQNEAV